MAEAQSKLNLYQKLAKITGEVGAIKKGGQNTEQKYSFIEYAAVAGELRGLFAKYGILIVPRMQRADKQIRTEVTNKWGSKGNAVLVEFYFTVVNADDPDDKFTVTWVGEAIDYGDKATNKAATSALKYYLMRQFNISEKGDDPDGQSHDLTETKTLQKSTLAVQPARATKPPVGTQDSTEKPQSNQMSPAQLKKMQAMFSELGIKTSEDRHAYVQKVTGREVSKTSEITSSEAATVITQLDDDLFYLTRGDQE